MRSRGRTDSERPQQQELERVQAKPERERDQERTGRSAQTGRARVPKIQYRFLRQLDESGVSGDVRQGALAMADKIKQYPLDKQHVMGSWPLLLVTCTIAGAGLLFFTGRGHPDHYRLGRCPNCRTALYIRRQREPVTCVGCERAFTA